MSEPLRIAAAVEGPTDAIVLEAVLKALLQDADFVFQTLQPEGSAAFGNTGVGWVGVYRWIRQSASEGGGSVSMNVHPRLSCVRLQRASKHGCLPQSGRKATWFGETIGSAAPIRKASSQPCPCAGGSGSARTTIDASKVT